MNLHTLERQQLVRRPLDEVFQFFSRASNLQRITPPWLNFRVLTAEPIEMRVGTLIEYRLRLRGVPLRWVSRIDVWEHGRVFVDRQLQGPYGLWVHRHEFERHGHGTWVRDCVRYAVPLGPLGALAHGVFVRRYLARVFDFRRRAVEELLG